MNRRVLLAGQTLHLIPPVYECCAQVRTQDEAEE